MEIMLPQRCFPVYFYQWTPEQKQKIQKVLGITMRYILYLTSYITRSNDKHFLFFACSSSHDSGDPLVVKPNSLSILSWGLFFYPGLALPSWARITRLSSPLVPQSGWGNHISPSSLRPKSTTCIIHFIHKDDSIKKTFSLLLSILKTLHGSILTPCIQDQSKWITG